MPYVQRDGAGRIIGSFANKQPGYAEEWLDELPPLSAPPVRVLTVLQFRDRLTAEEELAITAAGMSSPAVRVWLDRLAAAQEIDLDDPRTVAGLQQMEAAGLLAPGRGAEILA